METELSPYRVDQHRPLVQRILCRSLEEAMALSMVESVCPQTEGWGTTPYHRVEFIYLFPSDEGWRIYNPDMDHVEPLSRRDRQWLSKRGMLTLPIRRSPEGVRKYWIWRKMGKV